MLAAGSLPLMQTIIAANESNSQSKLPATTTDNKCNQTTMMIVLREQGQLSVGVVATITCLLSGLL